MAGFAFQEADLNLAHLASLLADSDWIFHQAGQPDVWMSWGKDFAVYVSQNIEARQRLLEAVKHAPA